MYIAHARWGCILALVHLSVHLSKLMSIIPSIYRRVPLSTRTHFEALGLTACDLPDSDLSQPDLVLLVLHI
jgi:hypothetical protein